MTNHICRDSGIEIKSNDRWISVKDRLPEKLNYYLCTYYFDKHRFYRDCWFNGHEFLTTDEITHWMPLPEPPNAEQN